MSLAWHCNLKLLCHLSDTWFALQMRLQFQHLRVSLSIKLIVCTPQNFTPEIFVLLLCAFVFCVTSFWNHYSLLFVELTKMAFFPCVLFCVKCSLVVSQYWQVPSVANWIIQHSFNYSPHLSCTDTRRNQVEPAVFVNANKWTHNAWELHHKMTAESSSDPLFCARFFPL